MIKEYEILNEFFSFHYRKKLENIQNELEIALEENETLKSEKAEQVLFLMHDVYFDYTQNIQDLSQLSTNIIYDLSTYMTLYVCYAQDKNFNGELQTMSKETGKLEQKMKSLKEDLSAKNKHSKELEKEVFHILMN